MEAVTVTLVKFKDCKHSVRFDAIGVVNPALASIYLDRATYDKMGQPKTVMCTVSVTTS